MFTLILLIVLVAVVLGFVGVLVKGLIWLLIIGCVIFALDLVFSGIHLRGRSRRRIQR
ncbi:MAG TPA: hypothetical protein VFI30_01535 [Nocardioidaceae bacterium]|nr:hypothetical protein [Nocardioidaceae bacterium]